MRVESGVKLDKIWNSKSRPSLCADMTPRQKSVDIIIITFRVGQGCRLGFLTFDLVDLVHSIASPIQSGVTSTSQNSCLVVATSVVHVGTHSGARFVPL